LRKIAKEKIFFFGILTERRDLPKAHVKQKSFKFPFNKKAGKYFLLF